MAESPRNRTRDVQWLHIMRDVPDDLYRRLVARRMAREPGWTPPPERP
ncbi:MAG: hypothetical protein LC624_00955 [Halobacteriales archaeon]|nr:hypothetical protein [Halobacteriales archaeon]